MSQELANKLSQEFENKEITDVLLQLSISYQNTSIFTTSFGIEDQVISHFIFENNISIKVATLDTGRLFKETYKTYSKTLEQYKKPIHCYFPKNTAVEAMITEKGPYSFYESVENRKECCQIRKIEPLKRLLSGNKLWITGIRADQSDNRTSMQLFMWDEGNQIMKYNPLLSWSLEDCLTFAKKNHVPYNILHDKGFVSIGCEPCTRAIQAGEDFRAGRWWWEDKSKKECGLHG